MSRRSTVALFCAICLAVAGVSYAASFTLTSEKLAAGSVATPILFPDAVSTANVGPNVGKMEKNDTITFTWSRPVKLSTVCSAWTQSTTTATLNWTIQNNTGSTGNDVFLPGTNSSCTGGLHIGSVDLGSSAYVGSTGAASNATTTISVTATTTTLTAKFAANPTGAPGTVTTGTAGVWTPDTAVTDTATPAHNCSSSLAKTGETNLF